MWFERTRHVHWRTLKSSGATSIFTVLFHLDLAGEADALALLAAGEVAALGREHRPAAVEYLEGADPAAPLAAARRRDEEAVRGEGPEQGAAGGRTDVVFGVVVDPDRHFAGGDEALPRVEEDHHQRQDDPGETGDPEEDSGHNWMPPKAMKPMAISPVSRKVMPSPRSAAGMWW